VTRMARMVAFGFGRGGMSWTESPWVLFKLREVERWLKVSSE
jgi:hypothetical protein